MRGFCCIIVAQSSAANIPAAVPSVQVDPATGVPIPGFAWWNYFSFYPSFRPSTTTIAPTTTTDADENRWPKNPQLNPNLFEGDILGVSRDEVVSIQMTILISINDK